jgi:biotin synthase-like enzyme
MGMTSGINALITGNSLTVLGRPPQQDIVMLDKLKMPIGTLSKVI